MLLAVPPLIVPIFAVVSASRRPNFILAIALAAISIAETPFSGSKPACAVIPLIVTSIP